MFQVVIPIYFNCIALNHQNGEGVDEAPCNGVNENFYDASICYFFFLFHGDKYTDFSLFFLPLNKDSFKIVSLQSRYTEILIISIKNHFFSIKIDQKNMLFPVLSIHNKQEKTKCLSPACQQLVLISKYNQLACASAS